MPGPSILDLGRLPVPGPYLVGREAELAQLDSAWKDPATHVLSLVAFGGVGKSALVSRWLDSMAADDWRGAEQVLGWSFFSQGSQGQVTSAEPFIDYALRLLGDADPTVGSPHDRGARLAGLVRQKKTLLVLDGVEPLQYGLGPLVGRLKDPGLAALIRGLALANPGLCLVTTREAIAELNASPLTAPRLDLDTLSPEAAQKLLGLLGVKGTDAELRAAAEEFGRHALTLTLLGNYLRRARGGDVRKRREVDLQRVDEQLGGQAFRVIAAYARWLGEGPELSILRLLGLFDRPADVASLAALRAAPSVRGLNNRLVSLSEEDWQLAVSSLREHGLLAAPEAQEPGSLDAHPLVRAYFSEDLRQHRPGAWQAGNLRLYEHLRRIAPEFPDSLETMQPLYAAVVHGCRAGKQQEALDEILNDRIERGKMFSTYRLGAYGSSLTALAGFFDRLWDQPTEKVNLSDRMFLLNSAGFALRCLGRLREAEKPFLGSLEMRVVAEAWTRAALAAGALSELMLSMGEVGRAVSYSEQSVALAERGADGSQIAWQKANLGYALFQAGRWEESLPAFMEAEEEQTRHEGRRLLYSVRGFQYCDLLLSKGEVEDGSGLDGLSSSAEGAQLYRRSCLEVVERAEQALAISVGEAWLLDVALDCLSLGRAHLGLALTIPHPAAPGDDKDTLLRQASQYFDRSIDGLQRADQWYLSVGLVARAAFRRLRSGDADAEADLREAIEIATRDSMRLAECDAHLEWTRLLLQQGGHGKVAKEHLAKAAQLVRETGYGRREREVSYLERRLAALPPEPAEVAMKDFFVSYNHADRSWGEWIAWTVEAAGYTAIIQAWDFLPGGNFVLEMQKAATGTRKTLIVLSDSYLRAEYTQPEWAAAFAQDPRGELRKLIPVRVASCSPAGLLQPLIYADLVGLGAEEAKAILLAAVSDQERVKPLREIAFPGAAATAGAVRASAPSPSVAPAAGPGPATAQPAASYPGGAPPAGSALAVWHEKLDFLEVQEASAADPAQLFALRKQIENARLRIESLGG
ncbi:MAG TPA: TIR domain-containing protein [Thermoanaerobaculia bacterium]|jgi:tetratricopeptide (TPR) repeat protein|nr:TIR domain-containing protein [Thermoanaerobaculia bacterium]